MQKEKLFFYYLFIYFCLFMAESAAYGSSQASGKMKRTCSCWPTPQPQQCQF